jgi:tetratricopeptide (TPR) repeat protein
MAGMTRRDPRSEAAASTAGDFGSTPLEEALVARLETADTGTLLIYGPSGALHAAVRVEDGHPCTALADDAGEHNLATLLLPVFGWSKGGFEFVRGEDLVGEHAVVRGRIDPLPLIAAAARGCTPESRIERAIGRIDRSLIDRCPGLDVNRYALTPQERLVVAALEPRLQELADVRRVARVPENVLRRVLYVLLVTGGISLLSKQRTVSGTIPRAQPAGARVLTSQAAPRSLPPRSLPPRSLPPRNGVPSRAASVRPDTARGRPSSASPQPPPTDPRARREQAEALWRRAEALAGRGEFEAALQEARAAIKLDQTKPEHDAMLGWLILQHAGGDERVHDHVWRCLDRAVKRDPLCEQVLYYKGLVLNLLGEAEHAHALFQRILMLKPEHAGANREVRIYEMRKEHADGQASFLRKLLSVRPKAK